MFHHISVSVADLNRACAFYDAVFATLGHVRFMEKPGTVSWWPKDGGPVFWVNLRDAVAPIADDGRHIAFRAATNEQVDDFYAAALAAGGDDDGAPGFRPQYRDTYYGAFVRDPDGNRIEAVCLPGT